MEENEENEETGQPRIKFINKVMMVFFGIAALLGWNALLTELDFFNYFLSDINPFVSFGFLNYILNISFQFILLWKKNIFSLFTELLIGIIGSIVFLIVIPLSAMTLGKNEMINKIITGGLVVIMGFINACTSGGFFGYAGYYPLEMIVLFTMGQGLSGIGLNILQYIVLASVNIDDEEKQYIVRAWIFFGFSIVILLICLFLLFYSYKDKYCLYYLNKAKMDNLKYPSADSKLLKNFTKEEENQNEEENQHVENLDDDEDILDKISPSFTYVFGKIKGLAILACFGYIVTFALFPNASIVQSIFDIGQYNSVTIISIYNGFDTIGRYLVNLIKPNKTLDYIIVLGRSILLFTIIFNYYCQERLVEDNTFTSILIMVNVAVLGVTNGIGAALTFGLASRTVEDEIKETTGNFIGFFSILGIFFGSCFAFVTGAIIDQITVNKK